MNIRRVVLDVDKALARPSVLQIAKAIEESPNVEGVNVTVTEIDIETVGMEVTIEGQNLDYEAIVRAIEEIGAVVHSVDEVISGSRMVERIAREMNFSQRRRKYLLPLVLGLSDGVLTALTLASGALLDTHRQVSMGMALRIGTTALATGAFVFFVARYSELRSELVNAERELNLTSHGRFASSRLGREVVREAAWAAALSSLSSFLGALTPLIIAVFYPRNRWAAVGVALLMLALLGVGLARAVSGNVLRWSATLVVGGVVLLIIGIKLRIM